MCRSYPVSFRTKVREEVYAMNSLLGLDLDKNGQFKIPLTFLPNAAQMEPVITSIVSNRVSRLKMPGKSYVQGSEFVLRRGKVEEGKDLDRRGIIWTKPEYHNMSKLSYLHINAEGNHHNSQMIMPFYFIKDGKKMKASDFTKEVDGKIVLDTDRIDPELLQMNGFRIPFQGHNSGMWFEIVGFLPEEAGDLVLVPGEIAGQMGSDYDVDKLYSYMYNYVHKESYERLGTDASDWERLKRLTNLKMADSGFEKDEEGRYSKEDYQRALGAVVEEEYVDKNLPIPKHTVIKKGSEKYEISKIHEDDPQSTEALQNAIIDAQKAIYTSPDPGIMKAILDPLSFKDVQAAIDLMGSEGTTTFLGAFDPVYQRDTYFSNVTGKLATAICANANTSHAMAQTSNLFIKGQGVMMLDENGSPYADRTGAGDTNRVNAYDGQGYMHIVKKGEAEELVDKNDGTHQSAWRLDKVNTFPDPVTGVVYRISNLISQLLGVSVDNAKEQLLGAFGINAENLNIVLTIVRAGFSLNVAKAFINQPILKEYYQAVGDAEDIFDVEFTSNRRDKIAGDLYKKYGKLAGLDDDTIAGMISRTSIEGFKFSQMRDNLNTEITAANAVMQLEIFKAYQRYKTISEGLATLTGTFGIDVKGLPKNMAETARKAEDIQKILSQNDVLGNVPRYADNTIPGLFLGIPDLAVSLFMNPTNPLFAYNSEAYTFVKNAIMELTGKKQLFADQIDTIHNHIKQFIYSGFKFDDNASLTEERKRLLFDTDTTDSLQTRASKLQLKYPKNEFLSSLSLDFIKGRDGSISPNDPKLISIEQGNEDDYVQKIQEYWENMLADDEHPDLKLFAADMLKYATWVQPQEFGNSNIIKYMPLVPMMKMGLSKYLNDVNRSTSDKASLQNFVKQFIQHNTDFLLSARESHFQGKPSWSTRLEAVTTDDGEEYMRTLRVSLNSFTLPAISADPGSYSKNKAADLIREGSYPKFLKFWTKEVDVQVYEGFRNVTDGSYTYYRIETLGDTNISEYNMAQRESKTMLSDNIAQAENKPDSENVMNALGATEVGTNEDKDYLTLGNVDDLLGGLVAKVNEVLVSPGTSQTEKSYAKYYTYLAQALQANPVNGVRIIIDNDLGVAGRTSADGKVIRVSPKQMLKGRTGMSPEMEKARTMLHELIHAKVFQALKEDPNSKEFADVRKVYEAFREGVQGAKDDTIRGVKMSTMDAELFSALKDMYDQAKGNADMTGVGLGAFVKQVINDEVRLRNVLSDVGTRLDKLAAAGKIGDKNYDLVSNQERFNAFKEHVQNSFQKDLTEMINKYYAYHNIHEFITEAMTNPKTQDILRGIPGMWKSFVDSIKSAIAKLLGIEDSERTLLDDALDSIFTLMSKGYNPIKTIPSFMMKDDGSLKTVSEMSPLRQRRC
jgi:hypothetical protein